MAPERKRKWQKIAILLACFFFLLPCGASYYWGNMSVYTISYSVVKLNSTFGVEGPWTLSMFNVAETTSFMACGMFFIRFIDRKLLILVSIALTAISTSATYFAIQNSMFLSILTFGILFGVGAGFLYSNVMQLTVEQADKDTGFLLSIVQNSFASGAMLINEILTWYVNPDNQSPDLTVGSKQYFSQKDVLSRVPSMYLVICGVFLVFDLIGFILLQFGSSINPDKISSSGKIEKNTEVESVDTTYHSFLHDSANHDYKPADTLKTGSFYILWLSFFITYNAFLFITTYYKIYGQIWIHNDHFLTDVGSSSLVASIFVKFGWGILIDKVGIKNCLILYVGSATVVNSFYYFTPIIDKYFYLFATMVYVILNGSLYITHLTAATLLFGKKHASGNFSLLLTVPLTCNLLAPLLYRFVLSNYGWFATFAGISSLLTIDLILLLILFPQL